MKGQVSFHASHAGTCRGCKGRIRKGDNVWAPGVKGQFFTGQSQGMYHSRCQPAVTVRKMTALEVALHAERRNLARQDAWR